MVIELLPEYRGLTISMQERQRGHWYYVEGEGEEHAPMPSVTTTLGVIDKSAPLMGWARKQAMEAMESVLLKADDLSFPDLAEPGAYVQWVSDRVVEARKQIYARSTKARDAGKTAHEVIAGLIENGHDRVTAKLIAWVHENHPQVAPAVVSAFNAIDTQVLHPVKPEYAVWHPKHLYAGTIDLVAEDAFGLIVVDWKRSKAIYPEHEFQVAAYAEALRALTGLKTAPRAVVVKLPQEGDEGSAFEFEAKWLTEEDQRQGVGVYLAALQLWLRLKEKEVKK